MHFSSMSSIRTYFLDKWSVGSTVERGYEHGTCGGWKGQEGKQASDVFMGSCDNVSHRKKPLVVWHVKTRHCGV